MPETIAALSVFGLLVIVPLVMMLLRHQKNMAEIIHRGSNVHDQQRIEALEREIQQLKALQHEQIIRADDAAELRQRLP